MGRERAGYQLGLWLSASPGGGSLLMPGFMKLFLGKCVMSREIAPWRMAQELLAALSLTCRAPKPTFNSSLTRQLLCFNTMIKTISAGLLCPALPHPALPLARSPNPLLSMTALHFTSSGYFTEGEGKGLEWECE